MTFSHLDHVSMLHCYTSTIYDVNIAAIYGGFWNRNMHTINPLPFHGNNLYSLIILFFVWLGRIYIKAISKFNWIISILNKIFMDARERHTICNWQFESIFSYIHPDKHFCLTGNQLWNGIEKSAIRNHLDYIFIQSSVLIQYKSCSKFI